MNLPSSFRHAAARLKSASRVALLAAAGTSLALLASEAALRVLHLAPTGGIFTVTTTEFNRIPGIFSPDQRVRDLRNRALPYSVTIDSLGFRGPNFARQRPPKQLRVLMIGDSHVFGDFVEDSQTLPAQLQERLQGACHDVLAINAGIGGSTIVDQAHQLQRAMTLDPNFVVLVYVAGDIEDLAYARSQWDQFAVQRKAKSRFPLSVLYPIVRNTALWNLALTARSNWASRRVQGSLSEAYSRDSTGEIDHLRARYGELLTAVRDTLAAHGVPFVFVAFPSWHELTSGSEDLVWLQQFARNHDIRTVDLLRTLQATNLPVSELWFVPLDGHPRPLAYSIAANQLAATMMRSSLQLESCRR